MDDGMRKFKVGVVGATGMVGQRFVSLLEHHPWFELAAVAASPRSAGKTYAQAVGEKWAMPLPIPENAKELIVLDASDAVSYTHLECRNFMCLCHSQKS